MVFVLLKAFANGGSSLTGIEAVSNAVGAFRKPEGRNARQVLVAEGLHPGLPGRRDLLAGAPDARHPVRQRGAHGHLPGSRPGVRALDGRPGHVLPDPGGDRADPVHRREHELQRVPVPGQLRGRGRVPAALADQARAPAGVLQRHHRADRGVDRAAAGRRVERERAGAVLRDRGVHRVLHRRVRHVPLPPADQGTRLAAQAGDQLLGRGDHADRGGDLRGDQVHRGRLAGRARVPDPGLRADPAEPGVPDGGAGAGPDRPAAAAAGRPAHLRPPDRVPVRGRLRPGHGGRAAVRPQPAADNADRGALRHRQRAGGHPAAGLAERAAPGSRWTSSTARTGGWPGPRPNWSAPRRKSRAWG